MALNVKALITNSLKQKVVLLKPEFTCLLKSKKEKKKEEFESYDLIQVIVTWPGFIYI